MQDLLKKRRFGLVACIDDENALPSINSIETLASALVTAPSRRRRNLKNAESSFTDIIDFIESLEDDLEGKKAAVRSKLNDFDGLNADVFGKAAAVLMQGHTGPTHGRLRKELHNADIEVVAFSFGTWQEQGKQFLSRAAADKRILLLVDEINDKEIDVDLNGPQVLSDIFATEGEQLAHIDAIMVTSNCAPSEEMDESKKIYEEIADQLKQKGFDRSFKKTFVLSKERLTDNTFESSFEWHLNRIEAAKYSVQLADATASVLQKAVQDSLNWLKQIPLVEFHHSVFVTTANEGAAEIDTLVRLASIRQRLALEKLLREDASIRLCIEEMRKVTPEELGTSSPTTSSEALRKLRIDEFEREGGHINVLRAPLACGDVFRVKALQGTAEREFTVVLLANPCDLVVRQDGKRKLTTGLLVEVTKMTKAEADAKAAAERVGAPLVYRLSTGGADDDVVYVFENSRVESIPLAVLDLCWTNDAGLARLVPSDLANTFASLSPPQKIRARALIERAEQGRNTRIELWGHDVAVAEATVEAAAVGHGTASRLVSYDVQRVWRLAPEFAAAALAALSQALARPAFGHNYLQH